MQQYRGTGVALITPFDKDGTVDYTGLKRLIDYDIENGADYLVSLGTTGESATLTKAEKGAVLEFTIKTIAGRVPLVAGFGGNNTLAVVDDIRNASFDGIDAILSVSPYYNKPTQEGIYQHYKAIANASPVPVILYNVPGRTSSNITAETTVRLARDFDNIVAVKEASGNLEQCMQIVKNKPEGFLVISGEDALTLPMMAFGMDGVISVVANAFPKDYSDMVRAGLSGNFSAAAELHYRLIDIIGMLFAEGNPGGVKCVLQLLDICGDTLRLPLVNVSDGLKKKMQEAVANYPVAIKA